MSHDRGATLSPSSTPARNSAHQLTSVTSAYPAQSGRGSLVAHEESDFSSKVDSWQRKINLESGLEESAVFGRRPARQGRAQSVTSSVTSSSVRGGGELVIYDGEVRLRRRRRRRSRSRSSEVGMGAKAAAMMKEQTPGGGGGPACNVPKRPMSSYGVTETLLPCVAFLISQLMRVLQRNPEPYDQSLLKYDMTEWKYKET